MDPGRSDPERERKAQVLERIDIPERFNRNEPSTAALGAENTGQTLIGLATREVGWQSLAGSDILDVGCGVRFTQTIVNRSIPIGSYTGIEVSREIVDYLKGAVEARDNRFRFAHWDVRNQMYNRQGTVALRDIDRLPVEGNFDLIWLFSVFTHLSPSDAEAMLRLLRRAIRPHGKLFFSAFIDPDLDGFEDRVPERRLLNAYFGRRTMEAMITGNGWIIDSFHPRDFELPIVDYFVCSPS